MPIDLPGHADLPDDSAYKLLGLTLDDKPKLIAKAQDFMRIVHGASAIKHWDIDATVKRLATSSFGTTSNRPADMLSALCGGAFTGQTAIAIATDASLFQPENGVHEIIIDDGGPSIQTKYNVDHLLFSDVRNGLELIEKAPTSCLQVENKISIIPPSLNFWPFNWLLPTKHIHESHLFTQQLDDSLYRTVVRELAMVSAVCNYLPGFDPTARIQIEFRKARVPFGAFTTAMHERPAFRAALEQLQKLGLGKA